MVLEIFGNRFWGDAQYDINRDVYYNKTNFLRQEINFKMKEKKQEIFKEPQGGIVERTIFFQLFCACMAIIGDIGVLFISLFLSLERGFHSNTVLKSSGNSQLMSPQGETVQ